MSVFDEVLKVAAQAAATAVGGPLAGLAAKELVSEALEDKEDAKPEETKPEEKSNESL